MGLPLSALIVATWIMRHADVQFKIMTRTEEKTRLHYDQSNKTSEVSGKYSCKRADLNKKYEQISKSNPIKDESEQMSYEPDSAESNLTTKQSIAKLKEEQKIDNEEQSAMKLIMDPVQRMEKFIDQILVKLDVEQQVAAQEMKTWKERENKDAEENCAKFDSV